MQEIKLEWEKRTKGGASQKTRFTVLFQSARYPHGQELNWKIIYTFERYFAGYPKRPRIQSKWNSRLLAGGWIAISSGVSSVRNILE
jgi:hypothetical protein